MASEMLQIPDQEVERLATEHGPGSIEARILTWLSCQRAKDWQVFAFRIGPCWITGPVPDGRTEAEMLASADQDDEE